jgi:hypothetical protein
MSIFDAWSAVNDAETKLNAPDLPWPQWRDNHDWNQDVDGPVHRSFTTLEGGELNPPADFVEREAWCSWPYRIVWVSYEHRVILTFCEGDLTYIQHDTEGAFGRELRDCHTFYVEEARG